MFTTTDKKDGTATGVAQVRYIESLHPPERRMFYDPFAAGMYKGSIVQRLVGPDFIRKYNRWTNMAGVVEMVAVRTRWFDDEVAAALASDEKEQERAAQLIILGAGYDTRGFRLDLWKNFGVGNDFAVIEVDQPDVQKKKLDNLRWLTTNNKRGQTVADHISSGRVRFLPLDFNTDDLQESLSSLEGFRRDRKSVVTLEAVSMYITKESTADTLTKLREIIGSGSTLLITYADSSCFADMDELPVAYRKVLEFAEGKGEPWLSGWSKDEFSDFLLRCGYRVLSDTSVGDHNDAYLGSIGRRLEHDEVLNMERFVVAKAL